MFGILGRRLRLQGGGWLGAVGNVIRRSGMQEHIGRLIAPQYRQLDQCPSVELRQVTYGPKISIVRVKSSDCTWRHLYICGGGSSRSLGEKDL